MTEHDALVRAVCTHPDDDTPRLIFADFLEEGLSMLGYSCEEFEIERL